MRIGSLSFGMMALLLLLTATVYAGNTVNIVASGYPSEDAGVFLRHWRSAWATYHAGNRMFKPTHAALLFAHGLHPIDSECFYYNPSLLPGELQTLNRDNLEAVLEWASRQGSLDIVRPSGEGGLFEENMREERRAVEPWHPISPPILPAPELPRHVELGPNDALNFWMLGYRSIDTGGELWYLDYPAREKIYLSELAELLWQAAGEGQLRVFALTAGAYPLYEELEARRAGRPLFCSWSTIFSGYPSEPQLFYLTDGKGPDCNDKAEDICNIPNSYHDRVACLWESAFARLPGDWNTYVGGDIDGILGPMDDKVYLSEAAAYDTSINSYHFPCYIPLDWRMTPGYVFAGASDVFLYRSGTRPYFTSAIKMGSPPPGCGGEPGNWLNISWNGNASRQYGLYYLPADVAFPVLELNEAGYTTVFSRPECLGYANEREVPDWNYLTSEFDNREAVPQYAPNPGTFSGYFSFPYSDGYIMVADVEMGLSSEAIDLSVQLAPPGGDADSPVEVALDGIFPNPFNPTTTISFAVQNSAPVKVTVYDLLGRQVAVLFDGIASQGTHRTTFDGSDLSSGLYFVRITSGSAYTMAKLYLLK